MTQTREIAIWLAGLLSTDGSIGHWKDKRRGVQFIIGSSELSWLKQIQSILAEVDLECTVQKAGYGWAGKKKAYRLYIRNPRKVVQFLISNNVSRYMIARKWKLVLKGYKDYFDVCV